MLRRWLAPLVLFAALLAAPVASAFDLPGLAAAGWEVQAYFLNTFNGIYAERPTTIPIRKFWFFLVMPWFACTLSLHALATLAEDLAAMLGREAWRERREAEV